MVFCCYFYGSPCILVNYQPTYQITLFFNHFIDLWRCLCRRRLSTGQLHFCPLSFLPVRTDKQGENIEDSFPTYLGNPPNSHSPQMKGPGRTITYKPIEWASLIKPLKEKERWRRFLIVGSQHKVQVTDFKLITELRRDFHSILKKWRMVRVRRQMKLLIKKLHPWQWKKANS